MTGDKEVTLGTELKGDAGKAFQAVGGAVPPAVRVKIISIQYDIKYCNGKTEIPS